MAEASSYLRSFVESTAELPAEVQRTFLLMRELDDKSAALQESADAAARALLLGEPVPAPGTSGTASLVALARAARVFAASSMARARAASAIAASSTAMQRAASAAREAASASRARACSATTTRRAMAASRVARAVISKRNNS